MHIYDNTPMQYTANFNYCKNVNFQLKMFNHCLSYICLEYRLWVLVRTASSIQTCTHNLCFRAKVRKNVYPCKLQLYYTKVGCEGYESHGCVTIMLNLAVGDTVQQTEFMCGCFGYNLYKMSKLVKFSPKRDSLLEKLN